jgi:hypothetical protein
VNLNPEDLTVESFATVNMMYSMPGDCCTGCVSGCGRNPTAEPCQSADGNDQL